MDNILLSVTIFLSYYLILAHFSHYSPLSLLPTLTPTLTTLNSHPHSHYSPLSLLPTLTPTLTTLNSHPHSHYSQLSPPLSLLPTLTPTLTPTPIPTARCTQALGMQSGKIPDHHITASSHYDAAVNAFYGR